MPIQSSIEQKQLKLDQLCSIHVIKTLLYADIFNYPMSSHEIHQNLIGINSSQEEVNEALKELLAEKMIFQHGFLFSMRQDDESCQLRKSKNELAKKYLKWAYRISNFIGAFPFVEGVFLSGSISKDCMDKDGDIDYFIITKPGRLWLSRTLLIAFKKIFLFNSYKYFCLNYFVDSEHLSIEKQNIYTATEILTLIPTYNNDAFKAFIQSNEWAKEFRPNLPIRDIQNKSRRTGMVKKFLEFLLGGYVGEALEKYFHKTTERHWQKKFQNYHSKDYDLAIQTSAHTSQINPENFHKKVLEAFDQKILNFERDFGIQLMNS